MSRAFGGAGTSSVSIDGTPRVSIANSPIVRLGGTPSVAIANTAAAPAIVNAGGSAAAIIDP